MSEKYKDALNKIVVTDELKEKIIANASSKKTMSVAVTAPKVKRLHYPYLRYLNMAACFLMCVCALLTSKYVYSPDIAPIDETPSHVAPISEADKQDQNNNVNNVVNAPIKDNDSPNHNTVSVVPSYNYEANIVAENPPTNKGNTDNVPVGIENTEGNSIGNIDIGNEPPISDTDVLVQSPPMDNSVLAVNPIYSVEDIEEIQKQVGYVFKLPQYVPDEYTLGEYGVMFGSLIEINYNSEDNNILYRTEKTDGNISGDYNEYERVETEIVNNTEITIKGRDDLYYNAVWNDDCAYALNIENGLDKETIIKIAESVDYPKGETAEAENSNKSDTETEISQNSNQNEVR